MNVFPQFPLIFYNVFPERKIQNYVLNKKLILRYNKFFKNGINFQLYYEYFAEKHSYSNYSELTLGSDYPSNSSDYILLDNYYCDIGDPNLNDADNPCSLNPNYYIYHYPNYNELNFNLVLSWEYSKKSNIYIIYKIRKSIVGKELSSYMDFINYRYDGNLNEIWNDQSIYIKIDYWFDF